jgi:hypothetical protein
LKVENLVEFLHLAEFVVSLQFGVLIAGSLEFPILAVALGLLRDSKEQGFQILQVLIACGQIDAESIPGSGVSIFLMLFQPRPEVGRKPHVVQRAVSIEGIDSWLPSYERFHDSGLIQEISREILKIFRNQVGVGHGCL